MRKSLLSLAVASLIGSAAFAQDIDSLWAANPDFATAVSVAERVNGIVELSGISDLLIDEGGWTKNHDRYKGLEIDEGVMTVSFKRTEYPDGPDGAADPDMWGDFTADWAHFTNADAALAETEQSNHKFTEYEGARDTLYGKVWNATLSDAVINAEYKLEVIDPSGAGITTASCRADLVDANARVGNASGGVLGTIEQNDLEATTEWTDIEWLFADQVYDQYTGDWWEVKPGAVTIADTLADFRTIMTYVPLEMTRITKLAFIIDHGATAEKQPLNKEVVFTFRNFTVGDATGDLVAVEKTATAADLGVYPTVTSTVVNVPGEAVVSTLLGQAVASGVDAVDVSGLTAGVYTVTVEGGSATIIVE